MLNNPMLTSAAQQLFPQQNANPNLNAKAAGAYDVLAQAQKDEEEMQKAAVKRSQQQVGGLYSGAAASLGLTP